MSLLLLSLVVVAWVFIPAGYSHADSVTTRTETYSSNSQVASPPATGYLCDRRESQRSTFPGIEERKITETCTGPDRDSSLTGNEYRYKREQRESHVSTMPSADEKKTVVETYRSSDADVVPRAARDYDYQYKSEQSVSNEVLPSPVVIEHDRTVVERDVPAVPREGRLQAWWHRNIHRNTD